MLTPLVLSNIISASLSNADLAIKNKIEVLCSENSLFKTLDQECVEKILTTFIIEAKKYIDLKRVLSDDPVIIEKVKKALNIQIEAIQLTFSEKRFDKERIKMMILASKNMWRFLNNHLDSNIFLDINTPLNNCCSFWGRTIVSLNLIPEKLYSKRYSYLYDIITKEEVPYLKIGTPTSSANTKALLQYLFEVENIDIGAPVRFHNQTNKKCVEKPLLFFLLSPDFEQQVKSRFIEENSLLHSTSCRFHTPESFKKKAVINGYKIALTRFFLNYKNTSTNKALSLKQAKKTNIFKAYQKYELGIYDDIAIIIGQYTGFDDFTKPDINEIDSLGHTVLDYQEESDLVPILKKEYGALNENKIHTINNFASCCNGILCVLAPVLLFVAIKWIIFQN